MVHETVVLSFILLSVIVALAILATRLRIPYPILLVIGGILLGFLPNLPDIHLDPNLIFVAFLPPLIFTSAWFTSWRDFRESLRPILLQAVGLVLLTMLLVAWVLHTIHPDLPWSVAFILGAVVSPTDTVAAGTVIKNFRLPHRLTTVIEGESLVNDATALVAYRFALAAALSGTFSPGAAALQFVLVSVGGVLIGLIIAWPVTWLYQRIDDATSEIVISLLTPYAAYLFAEALQLSGVLSCVAAGLFLGQRSATLLSANTRLQAGAFWNVAVFLLNGFIFMLIGLQLPDIIAALSGMPFLTLLGHAVLICLAVIVIRLIWCVASTAIAKMLSRLIPSFQPITRWRSALLIGWSGMRGGISLATALSIPLTLPNGAAFPGRDVVIFLTFSVILATLELQGLTLSPLIRLLHLGEKHTSGNEYRVAVRTILEAALQRIEELQNEEWVPKDVAMALHRRYEKRIQDLRMFRYKWKGSQPSLERPKAIGRFYYEILHAKRLAAIDLRDSGSISDEIFHAIEHDIDLEEAQFHRGKMP